VLRLVADDVRLDFPALLMVSECQHSQCVETLHPQLTCIYTALTEAAPNKQI